MNTDTGNDSSDNTIWKRGVCMLIFAFCVWLAKFVAIAVIVFQFFAVVFTGAANQKLLSFGQSLSTYQYQLMLFLTFNSEAHPFPMSDWPEGPPVHE